MANEQLKPIATGLLFLNFCMYLIVAAIGGWALNKAIDHGFIVVSGLEAASLLVSAIFQLVDMEDKTQGPDLVLPAHFSPIYFPMGNAATGFFVLFALIASVVGGASAIAGVHHVRTWDSDSLPSAASLAFVAWTLTLLAMGLACKEIEKHLRNSRLRTMEAFLIILSATQLFYIFAIHGASNIRRT